MKSLIGAEHMPEIPGLQIPRQFYWVLKSPAPLAGMAFPSPSTPWANIGEAGFNYVVCLTEDKPSYNPASLSFLHAVYLEDLLGERTPLDPEEEEDFIRKVVSVTKDSLLAGHGVVVHCHGGTGRTGTVIGCFLRTLGYSSSDIHTYMEKLNTARRKKPGWPESPWQAQLVDRFPQNL